MNHASEHIACARSMLLLDSASTGRPSISSTKLCAPIRLLKVQPNAFRMELSKKTLRDFDYSVDRSVRWRRAQTDKDPREPGRPVSFREEALRHGAPMQFPRFGCGCEDRITTVIGL